MYIHHLLIVNICHIYTCTIPVSGVHIYTRLYVEYIVHRYEHSDCGGYLSGWTGTHRVCDTTCQLHLLWNVRMLSTLDLLQVTQYSALYMQTVCVNIVCISLTTEEHVERNRVVIWMI